MTNDERNKIALFRYGIISPIISNPNFRKSKNEFFREAAEKTYVDGNGKDIHISPPTIQRWYYYYQQKGFDGLKPQKRTDKGSFRKLDQDMKYQIDYLKKEYPRIPATLIYDKLLQTGVITKKDVSLASITRYVRQLNLESRYTTNKDMRRYERAHINEVWCGDSSVGPYLKKDGKKIRIYIIALIDDASRMIVGIDIFENDNFINLMSVMKSAIQKHGKPRVWNFDNGSPYKNAQMTLLNARIGSSLNYCKPYTPTSKSKIERWFRTLKDHWMAMLNMDEIKSLEELKKSLYTYVNSYNNTIHTSLNGLTPQQRFFEDSSMIIRMSEEQINRSFLLEIERRVSADSVIIIDGVEYEVDYRYAKQRIRLRYAPDLTKIYLVQENDELQEIRILNKHDNAHIKREKVRLTGGDEE